MILKNCFQLQEQKLTVKLPSQLNIDILIEENFKFKVPPSFCENSRINNWKSKISIFADTDNQRVIIKVKDINDEPPYFINRPLPMQAVVKLNAPPNTPVFTLQAKDPDTDHNLHYFLVRDRSEF